ncbi:thioredoxin [Fusarium longipes]|uniref:Thioredoxin n=1 Tax=Fusarium longipes TaxID=694270 RepID=A0A395T9W2_9HYPO|nr:thioredoxin [Fusarium longipes]
MENIYLILGIFILFMVGKALFADRSPIPEASEKVNKVTESASLDAILSSNKHVVVDFYANWCPPCRAIAPVFSSLADKHASTGHLAFAKVNTDEVKDVSAKYGVSALPTFMFFTDGVPKGVAVEGLPSGHSVNVNKDGLVVKVLGADRRALEAVVKVLASKE